jgi:myosin heavy subunit
VEYNVRSFLEKNRDTINESLKTVLNGSEQMLMRKLLISRRFTCFTCLLV